MIHSYLLNFVYSTPWAILPSKLSTILSVAARHAAGEQIDPEQVQAAIEARSANGTGTRQAGAVAVINVSGTIIPHGDALAESSGAMSCDRIGALFHAALNDPGVGAVVLNFDSPGGSVSGVPELASDILESRGQKPVVAVVNHLCASAAYWLATAADEMVVTPSSECGSIGVMAAHQDMSGALEQAGVKTTLISAGKYKTEGAPFGPLSEEALSAIQSRVDEYYGMFTAAVAKGRGVPVAQVRGGFGEGRVVGAKEAVSLGMADRIDTLEGVVGGLLKPAARLAQTRASATLAVAGAIAPHLSPCIAPKDAPWDGPAEVAAADAEELPKMCAWCDANGDPGNKSSYKFPHHVHGRHCLVAAGVHAAAGRLDQADIPTGDKAGVRAHLQRHYHELDEQAPWESELEFRERRARAARGW